MKKLFLFLLVGCTVALTACKPEEVKDNNTLQGVVKFYDGDLEETNVAHGATLYLHNSTAEAYIKKITAKSDGSFAFTAVPDGTYQISASYTDTELFAQPVTYTSRTKSYKVAGEQVENIEIICK